jgi:uncharacterized protein YndB with AHSA1/START domain
MADILHMVSVKASPSAVYRVLSEQVGLAGWWTEDVHAEPSVGSIAKFRFGDRGGSDMQIVGLDRDRQVHWRCVGNLSGDEWVGTEIFFDLQGDDNETTVRFSQRRWLEATDFFRYCSTKWAVYLVSLKALVETGAGRPWPNDIRT